MLKPISSIKFIAIDDDPLDLLTLTEFSKTFPFLQNCGTFSNALEGLESQQYIKPDLVFLDIEMPGISGLDLLYKIRDQVPILVFITSHPEYALEGYKLSALDYILKPLTEERFQECVKRIQEFWDMKQKSALYSILFEKDTLTIKEGYNQVRLDQRDIIYLEAMQDYTKIVTAKKNYLTLSSLSYFMERLPADRFLRVHRSYAVSLDRVNELRQSELLCNNVLIPVGKTYRATVSRLKL